MNTHDNYRPGSTDPLPCTAKQPNALSHALDVYSASLCPCGVWVSARQSTHPSRVVGTVPLLGTVSFEAGFFLTEPGTPSLSQVGCQ